MIRSRAPLRWMWVLPLVAAGITGSQAYDFVGFRWPEPTTTMFVDLDFEDGTSPSGVTWNRAFRQAADAWNQSTVFSVNIVEEALDPCAGFSTKLPNRGDVADARNGVGFSQSICGFSFGSGTLAVTVLYGTGDGVFTETDLVFNTREDWDVYAGPARNDVIDFRRVAAHELGHVIGLDHEDVIPALMASIYEDGNTIEGPLADDIQGVAALYEGGGDDTPPPDERPAIVLHLEEPAEGKLMVGIGNLRGWVVGLSPIERVELFIDGVSRGEVPVGGTRQDVARIYRNYPNAEQSGFSQAFNYSGLLPGNHLITIRAYDAAGGSATASASFPVTGFGSDFIRSPEAVDLGQAYTVISRDQIELYDLLVEGRRYRLVYQWQVATQNFEIIAVERID